MMNIKEKLVELLKPNYPCDYEDCEDCPRCGDEADCLKRLKEVLADHLIENGVTIAVCCKDCYYFTMQLCKHPQWECCDGFPMVSKDDFCSYGVKGIDADE